MNISPIFALEDNFVTINLQDIQVGEKYIEYTNDDKTELIEIEVVKYTPKTPSNPNARIEDKDPWSGSMPYGAWTLNVRKKETSGIYDIGYKVDIIYSSSNGTPYAEIDAVYNEYVDFAFVNVEEVHEPEILRKRSTKSLPAMCEMNWRLSGNISGVPIFEESGYLNTKVNWLGQYQVSWRL